MCNKKGTVHPVIGTLWLANYQPNDSEYYSLMLEQISLFFLSNPAVS